MIYPENFEEKIGFRQIRSLIRDRCLSELGEDRVDKIVFSAEYDEIKYQLSITEEFRTILEGTARFPAQDYLNLLPELDRLRLEGTVIDYEKIFDLKISLRAILEVIEYIRRLEEEKFPLLRELTSERFDPADIFNHLDKIIDEKGLMKDNASRELSSIRRNLRSRKETVGRKISKSLELAKSSGWADKDVEPTIRGGRMVIPVSATNKRKIKGFIHDESASGQTVFIEPAEAFDTNNEIRDLENAEKREINRILGEFTRQLRPHIDELADLYEFLGQIDFIRAKAKYAMDLDAHMPELLNRQEASWTDARHPLLYLSHKAANKKVVPLNIELYERQRILVISGPNAGGKSVCLKTVGLLQYTMQCGIPVSMNKDSKMGVFDNIFIDIGDEQSLENDLSTYSSHLLNIKHFVEHLNEKSLFLIDEFGAGTEPQLGGAIAESVLETINRLKSFGVITTHYANLKIVADELEGVVNGAMLFDSKNLEPLYILKTGKPGSSFAFEIAEHIGFPKEVLKEAARKTGSTQLDFEKQLQQLEVDKLELEKQKDRIKVADDFLSEMIGRYEKLNAEVEQSRESILKEAKSEAENILKQSNKLIENTIREIKEAKAEKTKTRELREKISHQKEKISQIQTRTEKKETPEEEAKKGKIKKGDLVKIKDQNIAGEVIEVRDHTAVVSFDTFKLSVSIDKLQHASSKQLKKTGKTATSSYRKVSDDLGNKMANFKQMIDLRGQRVEEALNKLRDYIDHAILLNISEVSILHGKGSGALREAIRQYLSEVQEVKKFHDAHPDQGGHGITHVYFR